MQLDLTLGGTTRDEYRMDALDLDVRERDRVVRAALEVIGLSDRSLPSGEVMRAANIWHRRFDTEIERALLGEWTSQIEHGEGVWFGDRRMCTVHRVWLSRAEGRALLGVFLGG